MCPVCILTALLSWVALPLASGAVAMLLRLDLKRAKEREK